MNPTKEEAREDFYGKLRDTQNLMTGLLEIMEKTFDAMFELQWTILGHEVEGSLVPKSTKKTPSKRKTPPTKKTTSTHTKSVSFPELECVLDTELECVELECVIDTPTKID